MWSFRSRSIYHLWSQNYYYIYSVLINFFTVEFWIITQIVSIKPQHDIFSSRFNLQKVKFDYKMRWSFNQKVTQPTNEQLTCDASSRTSNRVPRLRIRHPQCAALAKERSLSFGYLCWPLCVYVCPFVLHPGDEICHQIVVSDSLSHRYRFSNKDRLLFVT